MDCDADTSVMKDSVAWYRTEGKNLRNAAKYQNAIAVHTRGLELAKEIGDTLEVVQALNNIGTVYRRMVLLDDAASWHYQALTWCEEWSDKTSDIAQKNSVSVSRLYELNPELTETLQIGQKILVSKGVDFIRVQTTKTEYKEAEIPFETVTISTSSLYVGDKKTVTKGENGVEQIAELVTYIDGVRVESKDISRTTIKDAVSE